MKLTPHSLIKSGQSITYQPPFISIDVMLNELAQKYPKKSAIIFDDYSPKNLKGGNVLDSTGDNHTFTLTYPELREVVQQAKSYLFQFLPSAGSVLSFCFPNSPEVVLLNLAAWGQGWITVPLDSKRDTTKIKIYKLKQTQAKVLFTRSDKTTQKENQQIKKAISDLKIIEVANINDFLTKLSSLPEKSSAQIEQNSTPNATPNATSDSRHAANLDRTALILYTSGTTALPKGAKLTLRNLLANAASIADWLHFTNHDRWLVVLPLHHINSSTFVNTTLLSGGTIVLVPQYSKSRFWKTLAKHHCTGTSIVPTIAYDLLSEKESFAQNKDQLKQVERFQLGSAPVQPTVVKKFIDQFGIRLQQGYGQTETSLRSTGVPMGLSDEDYQQLIELNTLGTELKYTNVAVLDHSGHEVAEGEIGEICVRGPIIMQGYLDNEKATTEAFAHQWFHSGDTGYWRDLKGHKFFFLKGRTKEIIKKGGVLISPLAIENALLQTYPDIKKVYVVGIPDQRLGEKIGFVVISENKQIVEHILSDCQNKKLTALSPFEYPVAGLLITQSELPLTSTGKVQRIKIKELFGPKLALKSTIIARTDQHIFKVIRPDEKQILQTAVEINNQRWGEHLAATLEEFESRAEHGILIGMFEKPKTAELEAKPDLEFNLGKLIGTISGVRIKQTELAHAGEQNHWTSTWNGITSNGGFDSSEHKGEAIVLVAVSTKSSKTTTLQKPLSPEEKLRLSQESTQKKLAQLIATYQDPVLTFHAAAKGGFKTGAKIISILPQSRPADLDALGYCVLMQYPDINSTSTPHIDPEASYGSQLVEAAMVFAFQQKMRHVFAYSRPSSLRQNLL